MHYFGPWDDPDGALKKYLRERDDLQAGMPVPIESNPENPAVLTVKRACNLFLESKQRLMDAGELLSRCVSLMDPFASRSTRIATRQ